MWEERREDEGNFFFLWIFILIKKFFFAHGVTDTHVRA